MYDHGRPPEKWRIDEVSIWAKDHLIELQAREIAGLRRVRDSWRWPLMQAARKIQALRDEVAALRREILRLEEERARREWEG